ncbi:MAG: NADH:ubiquinone oxidoreductase subunit NDUFA12, partial [Phenylobacterium sp.]|nr:NADH:ubiquinone oxidoreductase subunit NDUFA12 [Phenylobacterium sp.]
MLKAIFTWWNGATIGAGFHIKRRGVLVGQDDYGNRYFEARDARDSYDGRRRR